MIKCEDITVFLPDLHNREASVPILPSDPPLAGNTDASFHALDL